MARGTGAPLGRRAWLVGRVALLLITVTAGILAIVHYSSWGAALAGPGRGPSAARTHPAGATVARRSTSSGSASPTKPAGAHSAAPGATPHRPTPPLTIRVPQPVTAPDAG